MVLVLNTGVTLHPNIAQTYLLLDAFTYKKTVKLIQLNTISAHAMTMDIEIAGSNNSGEHTLHSPYTLDA